MQAHVTSGAELPALGVDIVRVERIAKVMQRHPARFPARVLTDAEQAYVRARPENFAGRWAAKEAVSKVLGLGIRGIGWREIEIERLPTGQPTVRLHGSAAERAVAIGIAAIAVSITHEREYAVAVAYGQRAVHEA
jgi:holo-[acyl-carrier protein] synthase